MTAWHDEPPVSRRQVRQTERDEDVVVPSTPEQNAPEDTTFTGIARQGWEAEARRVTSSQEAPENRPEGATGRGRRVQQPASNERGVETEPESLAHITQARPQVPSYDGASFRGHAITAAPGDSDLPKPAEPAKNQPDFRTRDFSPSETDRSAFRPVGPPLNWAPPVVVSLPQPITAPALEVAPQAPSAEASAPEPLLTRRQMRELGIGGFVTTPSENDEAEQAASAFAPAQPQAAPVEEAPVEEVPVEDAPVEEAPVEEAPVEEVPVEEVPVEEAPAVVRPRFRDRASRATVDPDLEREESRAVQEETQAPQAPNPGPQPVTERPTLSEPPKPIEPPTLIEPPVRATFTGAIPTGIPDAPRSTAPARPVPVSEAAQADITELVDVSAPPAAVSAPVESSLIEFVSTPVLAVESVEERDVVVAELQSHPAKASAFEDLLFPSGDPIETTVEPERADAIPTTFDAFLGAPDAPAANAADSATAAAAEVVYVPPIGHWSTQALIDDDEQVQENSFARDVGATSGAITTSALVLPSMPTGENIMGPLSGTGEILITGSINLPSSMGSTGVHPARYDHSDVDALLEADDREDSDPESAPVRAIRAVSTNTASGDVINSMKPRKASRLPLILIVSAAVMAVGVVVLLVAGFIFKIF